MSTTITTILAITIGIILFRALVRQTLRADRAEAAFARVEATIREGERGAAARLVLDRMRAYAGKLEGAA